MLHLGVGICLQHRLDGFSDRLLVETEHDQGLRRFFHAFIPGTAEQFFRGCAAALDDLVLQLQDHPLGGLDGLALISLLGNRYDHCIKFLVNDLLMAVEPLRGVFLPVNKYGKQSRDAAAQIEEALSSDVQFITFPAGLCSRMQPDGTIADLTWQKAAVVHAVNYQRDIVPVFFDACNSKFFYRFAKWRKKLGIKFNIELIFLPKEMLKQSGSTLHAIIGEPIPWASLDGRAPKKEAARLRDIVYQMKPTKSK